MSGSNRVAIITGASRGLGFVIGCVLADRGYDLVIGARGADALEQAAEALSGGGTRVRAVAGDVTDAAVRARLIAAARALGGLDVLVDPGDMRTRMHQEAFPNEDISDRPLPDVTRPFWQWLFDQAPDGISGGRFEAQAKDGRWLQHA